MGDDFERRALIKPQMGRDRLSPGGRQHTEAKMQGPRELDARQHMNPRDDPLGAGLAIELQSGNLPLAEQSVAADHQVRRFFLADDGAVDAAAVEHRQ